MEGAIGMKDAKNMDLVKAMLNKATEQGRVFPVLVMSQPSFPCMKPIAPFKCRMGA